MIDDCFDNLAHAFSKFNATFISSLQLVKIDSKEADGTMNLDFASLTNCFSSLNDAIQKTNSASSLDWRKCPELYTIIAIRNAQHHNHANKIRSIFSHHIHNAHPNTATYTLLDYDTDRDDRGELWHYLSFSDLLNYLDLPQKTSRLKECTVSLIHDYLCTSEIKNKHSTRISTETLFFNAMPLLVNAGIQITKDIQHQIPNGRSDESDCFKSFFLNMKPFRISNQSFNSLELKLPT